MDTGWLQALVEMLERKADTAAENVGKLFLTQSNPKLDARLRDRHPEALVLPPSRPQGGVSFGAT